MLLRRGRLALVGGTGLLALVLAGCTGGSSTRSAAPATTPTAPTSVPGSASRPGSSGATFGDIPRIVHTTEPSVVTITTGQGLGSGVVWAADGTVVTVAHVVAGAPRVGVQFADGKQTTGMVVASDEFTDLAVVRVPRTGLPAATFAPGLPEVGALTVVIGTPLGLQETVTAGIVSALGRDLPASQDTPHGLVGLIQTDAPISPGNSGGGVFNASGQAIGLSEAYVPPSQGAVAIGFATPSTVVRDVVPQLLATGHARHAYLGIQAGELTPQIGGQLGLAQSSGVLVIAVQPGSPAAQAGLQPGDVIVDLGGHTIANQADLQAALRQFTPGQRTSLTYIRDNTRHTVQVTLADYPAR